MDWQIQQEIGSLMRQWGKAKVEADRLFNNCKKWEERIVFGDWYEPEVIIREVWLNRDIHETERVKYRMREGRPPYGSDEVKRRTAQTIKDLDKYTAKVKTASGEYIIKTIAPAVGLDNEALQKRIAGIQERNLAAGYLRLRSDVEKEILERQQPLESVQQETAVIEKSRGQNKPARAAGAVPPPATRRLQGKIGE